MSYVFISYSSKDRKYADQLQNDLFERGFDVWMDYRNIPFEEGFFNAIAKAIRGSGAVIVLMSPNSNESVWVEREYYLADKESKKLFPILIAGEAFDFFVTFTYADGRDGKLPVDRWYTELAQSVSPKSNARGEDVTPIGLPEVTQELINQNRAWITSSIIGLLAIVGVLGALFLSSSDGGSDGENSVKPPSTEAEVIEMTTQAATQETNPEQSGQILIDAEAGQCSGECTSRFRDNTDGNGTMLVTPNATLSMPFDINTEGTYRITIRYGFDQFSNPATIQVDLDRSRLGEYALESTNDFGAGWNAFGSVDLGQHQLADGNHTITLMVVGSDFGVEIDYVLLQTAG